jgi:hypothetical protein
MIQAYLGQEAEKLESDFLGTVKSAEDWNQVRPRFRQEYLDMLGLWPMPEKTPLHATITRTLDRRDYVIDMLHYQSRPGLYVTANLYRPAKVPAGTPLRVLCMCAANSGRHSLRPKSLLCHRQSRDEAIAFAIGARPSAAVMYA